MLAMREDVANCISDQSSTHKTIGNGDYHGVLMLLVLGVFVFCFFLVVSMANLTSILKVLNILVQLGAPDWPDSQQR